jgi:hypothetical protein
VSGPRGSLLVSFEVEMRDNYRRLSRIKSSARSTTPGGLMDQQYDLDVSFLALRPRHRFGQRENALGTNTGAGGRCARAGLRQRKWGEHGQADRLDGYCRSARMEASASSLARRPRLLGFGARRVGRVRDDSERQWRLHRVRAVIDGCGSPD